ncbi:MAG: DUF932 domain-containing protein [Acidimicrobiia bacterium]|nr:MAG: DUF932 domain-containing protein [Acidimicrobiia bacterium]
MQGILNNVTRDQALSQLGLDWTVVKAPVKAYPKAGPLDGAEVAVPGLYALLRSDDGTPLGSCGERYTPYSNGQMLELLEKATKIVNVPLAAATCWRGGRQVSFTIATHEFEAVKGDEVKQFAIANLDHTGAGGITFGATNVRPVCWNTWRMAVTEARAGGRNSARHTVTVDAQVEALVKRLVAVREAGIRLAPVVQGLAQTKAPSSEVFFRGLFGLLVEQPKEAQFSPDADGLKKLDEARERFEYARKRQTAKWEEALADKRQDGVRGTLWGLFNAVTQYVDHASRASSEADRAYSATFGRGADVKDAAFKFAVTTMQVGPRNAQAFAGLTAERSADTDSLS